MNYFSRVLLAVMGIAFFIPSAMGDTGLIKDLDVLDAWMENYNASHWIEQGDLRQGQSMYGEENIPIISLPDYLKGADWIQTAYGSKSYALDSLAFFELKADAWVYIIHNSQISQKPGWLKGYEKEKGALTSGSGTFGIFKKRFRKGERIMLGNNGSTRFPMYLVAVRPVSAMPEPVLPKGKVFDIIKFGAKGDGRTVNTIAIQKAIDQCAEEKNGGIVYVHDGIFVSGTLVLKDNVTLFVQAGSILRGSADHDDYPAIRAHLPSYRATEDLQFLFAEGKKNITITGGGIIDGYSLGNGYPWKGRGLYDRPRLIRMFSCKNVTLDNITLIRSAFWTQYYDACDSLTLLNINVRCYTGTHNQDGIDISGCKDVLIKNFSGICGDDVICLKSQSLKADENILVDGVRSRYANCHLIKIGTETHTGVKNVIIRNVVGKARYGIAVECADGADIENILYENMTLLNCSVPLFIRLGNRGRTFEGGPEKAPVGTMKNITIRNVKNLDIGFVVDKEGPGVGSAIAGLPYKKIENLTIENCDFLYYGSIHDREFIYRDVPESEKLYPEFHLFGKCPAYGLYFRHINNLVCKNVNVRVKYPDVRPPVVLDDVQNYDFKNVECEAFPNTEPKVIWDKQKDQEKNKAEE